VEIIRNTSWTRLTAALMVAGLAIWALPSQAATPEQWARGRILVSPKSGLPTAEFDKIIKSHGAKRGRKLDGINVYVIDMPIQAHGREHSLAQSLKQNPHIKFAEVDGAVSMQQIPADPYFANAWHLPITQSPAAWDLSTGSGITIAILDGGVESTHPDLAAHIVPGWNFYDNNSNTGDVSGHGTKVAGVAAAVGDNNQGVTGVAWNAKIMPMRISDPAGSLTYYSIVANSLTWAADHGARVANISYIVSNVATIQNAAQYMRSKGGVVVASAGNSGAYDASPSNSAIVTVAATDSADQRASWSAYGPIVDVTAPGVGIWTTTVSGGYGAVSGTSFSSPLTAGVVALILSANPALQPSQVDSILTSTADDLGVAGRDDFYGAGRVNAYRAVMAAKSMATADTQAPSVSIASPTGGTVTGITQVNVSAADNVGVTRVDLFAGGALVASDIATPYSFSWDTASRADGTTTVVAKAYDAAGNVASTQVNVTVANVVVAPPVVPVPVTPIGADVTPPRVVITNPVGGTTVNGNVTINVNVTDNVSVASASLYIDGVLKSTSNTSISYNWNTRKISGGTHSIQAVARDAAGNTTTQTVQVTK